MANRFDNLKNLAGDKYPIRLDLNENGNYSFINYETNISVEEEQDTETIKFKRHHKNELSSSVTTSSSPTYTITIECKNDYPDKVYVELERRKLTKNPVYFDIYDVVNERIVMFGKALVTGSGSEFNAEESITTSYTLTVQGTLHRYGVNETFMISYIPGALGGFDPQTLYGKYLDATPYFNGDPEPLNPDLYKFIGWNNLSEQEVKDSKILGDITYEAQYSLKEGAETIKVNVVLHTATLNQDGTMVVLSDSFPQVKPITDLEIEQGATIGEALIEKTGWDQFVVPHMGGEKLVRVEIYKDKEYSEGSVGTPDKTFKSMTLWIDFMENAKIINNLFIYFVYDKKNK